MLIYIYSPSLAIVTGILGVAIFNYEKNTWGPIDMLLARRLVVFLGLSNTTAMSIISYILSGGATTVATLSLLASPAGMIPLFISLFISATVIVTWHFWDKNKKAKKEQDKE